MNILVYAAFISRSDDIESLLVRFKQKGHSIFFLNQQHSDQLEAEIKRLGGTYHQTKLSLSSKSDIIKNVIFLIKYCRKNKIDVVFSHLDPPHTIAVIAQYFIKARVILVRHHADDVYLNGSHRNIVYRGIYKLAKRVIVVSEFAREFMISHEKVSPNKIDVIRLSYDLSNLRQPDLENVKNIKREFPAALRILVVGRMVVNKRTELAVKVASILKEANIDFVMLLLGVGPLEKEIQAAITEKQLGNHCFMVGYKKNILDYIEASDLLLHPSSSESSSLIVKEFGFRKKPVIVCKGVGDFDEVVIPNEGGITLDKDRFVEESVAFLLSVAKDKSYLQEMGAKLHQRVTGLFDVNKNIRLYDKYLQ